MSDTGKKTQTKAGEPRRAPGSLSLAAEQLAEALPPLLAQAEHISSTVMQGLHGRRQAGTGETFWQYRRFSSGDEATAIDWRQSARSRHLYIRENEWEAAASVWIWRDPSISMDYTSLPHFPTKADRASVLALALAATLLRGGERVSVMSSDPASGHNGLKRLAHALLDRPHENDTVNRQSLPPLRNLPRHAQLVLIGDLLVPAPDLIDRMKAFAAMGIKGHLLQILDPAEEDLPFTGRAEFEGIEEPLRLVIGKAETLRDAYHERLTDHRTRIAQTCATIGWTFATHRTDRPPETALLALHTAIAGGGFYAPGGRDARLSKGG